MKKNTPQTNTRLPVGIGYFAILASTVFLLLVATLCLLIGLAFGLESGPQSPSGPSNGPGGSVTTGTVPQPNGQPIYPTVADRDSYLFAQGADVQTIESGIASNHAILVSLDSYTSIAERAADERIYPASMVKVMSLLVACERATSLTEKVVVEESVASYAKSIGGSGIGLRTGEELTVKDLIYLTSYQSDTIAVLTLVKHLAGSEEAFVAWMNEKAQALGLTNTHFANVTGLHDTKNYTSVNYTTCREMATIMAYALENELCRLVLSDTNPYYIENNYRKQEDGTRLAPQPSWLISRFKTEAKKGTTVKLNTVQVMGGKTGHEDIPKATFVTYAKDDNGTEYICVVVGRSIDGVETGQASVSAEQSTNDTRYIYNHYVP